MSLVSRRACALLALSLLLALPGAAHAIVASPPTVLAAQAQTTTGTATEVTLIAEQDLETIHDFVITGPATHGEVAITGLVDCHGEQDFVHTRCTVVATYTPAPGFVGTDSFSYTAADLQENTSLPATVTIQVASATSPPVAPTPPPAAPLPPTAPTVSGSATASSGSDWVGMAGGLLAGATVDYGDLSGATPLTVNSTGSTVLRHAYGAARTYTVTVTNHGPASATSATTTVLVQAVTAATPSQLILPPNTVGTLLSPGLYVQVTSGLIQVTAGGSTSFTAGQFGFTPALTRPPVIIPPSPGIRFTPPPTFAPAKVLSSSQLTITGADAKTSATVDVDYRRKMYCNSRPATRQAIDCEVRALHSSAVKGETPELWFIAGDGKLRPVLSSSRQGASSGVNAKAGVVTMTLDDTSTPTLASLARTTSFAVLVRQHGRATSALRRTRAAHAVRWPARTTISSGVVFTCPKVSTRGCSVRLRATSKQFGVSRVVGARTLRVKAGATAPLDFTLARPGRWRLATRGLVATLSADAVAYQPNATREHQAFGLRVRLPR